jgi:hypothetical protein
MRHHLRKAVIVVAFDPDHLSPVARVRKLSNISKEFPVFFGEPPEIKVAEDVAQQNQTIELD